MIAKEGGSEKDDDKKVKQASTSYMWAMQEVADWVFVTEAVDS